MDRFSRTLHLLSLLCGLAFCQPAVAQTGPQRGPIGPETTSFPPNDSNSVRTQVATIYTAQVGTLEIGKNNYGPGPKKYLAACSLPEGYPYCVCFVKWVFTQAGITTTGGTAWSPSWFPASKVIWKPGKSRGTPQQGDIFSLYYPKLGRIGHGGFVDEWAPVRADDWVFTTEANTNAQGSREGDGVHHRRRLIRDIHSVANWIDP